MALFLRNIINEQSFGDLPAEWRRTDFARFSGSKQMRGYQRSALESAACALHLYFSGGEKRAEMRKFHLAQKYRGAGCDLSEFETPRWMSSRSQERENPAYRILTRAFAPRREGVNDFLPFEDIINRMSFWMATGSGKTLVMIKLAEMLTSLMESGAIPRRDILVLAPRDDLLSQIRASVDEFNEDGGMFFDWTPLNKYGEEPPSLSFGKSSRLYYWRGDNIAEEGGEARVDYRKYENGGKWYVLLDEAHKGGVENSRRQAYYSLFSREGFLFNFSATFTDSADIASGVCKYNLQDFVGEGYGKHIMLSQASFGSFHRAKNGEEIDAPLRREILLKSLVTLAHAKMGARQIRKKAKRKDLYHEPLMVTLVNSVNTEQSQNDLWAFFALLRDIAAGRGDVKKLLDKVKKSLAQEWRKPELCFESPSEFLRSGGQPPDKMTLEQLREMVFNSPKPGALHVLDPGNGKELAFQLNVADAPFAMLRIGEITRWRNNFLRDLEIVKTPPGASFFKELENGRIGILMGSRAFIEGWDSNRPNVINFINIGGHEAKKFIAQAIGRGVRIEPVPGQRRRRLARLNDEIKKALKPVADCVAPVETVFVYATNRGAVQSVLNTLDDESAGGGWRLLEGFEPSGLPLLQSGEKMPLLKPKYRHTDILLAENEQLPIGAAPAKRLKDYLQRAGDEQLILSRRLLPRQVKDLHIAADKWRQDGDNNESVLAWLSRYRLHSRRHEKAVGQLSELSPDDIVHFRRVEARYSKEEHKALAEKIKRVAKSGGRGELRRLLENGEISIEEYDRRSKEIGEGLDTFDGYSIRRIAEHYYAPVVSADGRVGEQHIRHIINTASEVEFIRDLVKWIKEKGGETGWDNWMFSKVDESLDKIYLPYYDPRICDYSRFFPDFVFWLQKGGEYRIVFVDPHGINDPGYMHKIDGFEKLFEKNQKPRRFSFGGGQGGALRISVKLVFYHKQAAGAPKGARRFWHARPDEIFARD